MSSSPWALIGAAIAGAVIALAGAAVALFLLSGASPTPRQTAPPPAATTPSPAGPQIVRDCPECPELVVLAEGTANVGIAPDEWQRPNSPQVDRRRQVYVGAFAIGRYEVTRDEYEVFARATGRTVQGEPWTTQTGRHPVTRITPADALAYVDWLSQKTGKRYRLPTDYEWEFAARTTTPTGFWWGSADSRDHANFGPVTVSGGSYTGGKDRWYMTSPVGSFPPNPWGLYDIEGNAAEYTLVAPTVPPADRRPDGTWARGATWDSPQDEAIFRQYTPHPRVSGGVVAGMRVARDL